MEFSDAANEPKRKIARAVKLFREAQNELDEWAATTPVTAHLSPHADRRRIDMVVDLVNEPPLEDAALTIGDAVHNLRSALDNLAWTLAHRNGPPANPKSIYFPVCEKSSAWTKAKKDLVTVPSVALDRIATFQPFTFDGLEQSFLWLLHRLDIADKHRDYLVAEPHLAGAEWQLTLGMDAGTTMDFNNATPRLTRLSAGLMGWVELSKPFWEGQPLNDRVKVGTSFLVSYEQGGPTLPVASMVADFPRAVEAIVDIVCYGEVRPSALTY